MIFKYGTIYSETLDIRRYKVCRFINVTEKDNIVIYNLIKTIQYSMPKIIYSCPYTVTLKLLIDR